MRWLMLFAISCCAQQVELANLNFEEQGQDGLPSKWVVPEASRHFNIRQIDAGCLQGRMCIEMKPGAESGSRFGTVEQTFGASRLKGMSILFSASVRAAKGAQFAMQVKAMDANGELLNLSNNLLEAVKGNDSWVSSYLKADIPPQTERISLSLLAFGGRVIVDSVSIPAFTTLRLGVEGSIPLNRTALNNLVGFARLFGEIRYSHPSDQAVVADWTAIAIEGVRKLDYAVMAASLGRREAELFATVAPGVKFYSGPAPPLGIDLSPKGKQDVVRLHHDDLNSSRRIVSPLSTWSVRDIKVIDLGRGLKARIPSALFRIGGRTVPFSKSSTVAEYRNLNNYNDNDRPIRLANIILIWNVVKHLYSTEKLEKVDWDDALVRGLQQAAIATTSEEVALEIHKMLERIEPEKFSVLLKSSSPTEGSFFQLAGAYSVRWQPQP